MKNYFFTLILTCTTLICLNAQEPWDLFPYQQKSWWQKDGYSIELFYCDSATVDGDYAEYHFGFKYIDGAMNNCVWPALGIDPILTNEIPESFYYSLERIGGGWIALWASEVVFNTTILPGAHFWINASLVGNTGVFDEIKVTCTLLDTIQVFGQTTAAKHFEMQTYKFNQLVQTALSGQKIVLTERFGLIEFVPFQRLLEGHTGPVYRLIGMEHDGEVYGYNQREETFLGMYAPGDVMKWQHYHFDPLLGKRTWHWQLDSVLTIQYTPDTLLFTVLQQNLKVIQSTSGGITTTDSTRWEEQTIRKIELPLLRLLLDCTPEWLLPVHPGENSVVVKTYSPLLDVNQVGYIKGGPRYWHDVSACSLSELLDIAETYFMNSHCGYTGYTIDFFGSLETFRLQGCRNTNGTWGDLSGLATVSVNTPVQPRSLRIFPQPAGETVWIEGFPDGATPDACRLLLLDGLGRTIRDIPGFQPAQGFQPGPLAQGLYQIILQDTAHWYTGKLLISN